MVSNCLFHVYLCGLMSEFIVRKGEKKDCREAIELIKELAIYEKAEDEAILKPQDLERDGFGELPKFGLLVAESKGKVIGISLFYEKYSTWKGSCLYLEDLVVTKEKRGIGAGKALFEATVKEAKNRNAGRMEWQVLDWNAPAIGFYKNYGADIDESWYNGRFNRQQIDELTQSFS